MGVLEGKVAIVTGAASGMGKAIVERYVLEGATVLITDISEEAGKALSAEHSSHTSFFPLDVSEEWQWQTAVEEALSKWKRIDILVNNAGIAQLSPLSDMSLIDYRKIVEVNQTGVFLGMRECIPHLKRAGGGAIINNASIGGVVGQTGFGAYNASKHAVVGMTKAAALELAVHNIRVNAVLPGGIDTPMGAATPGSEKLDLDANTASYPMGRLGSVEEVAGLFAFLASADSSYISGAAIPIDGAWTAGIVMRLKDEFR
ncbi:MAG: SDR family NAD(P)-dependent oxidoreductase [Gammaproteobacteria bacterium]|nr:SDR family NAD(P)-dependent oxidoreductase [Gammaproteobacteria bacterium]MDE0364336.1 SDR family NAD(P)-dependent oxidoreductase [Gammaproteobacteria bacterium]